MNHRFIIACGGTGGHFYPGLALGLSLREKGAEVLFVVRQAEPSIEVLKTHHLSYQEIDLCGLPRSVNPARQWKFFTKLLGSLNASRRLIQTYRPDVVLGTGGYISFPVLCAAKASGIKTAVHDSNSRLGLVNAFFGRFANLFMIGLPLVKKVKTAQLVGTPIRPEFSQPVDRQAVLNDLQLSPDKTTVLVMGGSQGAKGLNEAVISCARALPQIQFIHICGTKWFDVLHEKYKDFSQVRLLAYSHEIYKLMKSVDLTICRSGAGTLAELIACRLPAVLIPFPHAAANHQYFNAKVLADAGAAHILLENPQLGEQLTTLVRELTPVKLEYMRQAYAKIALDPLHVAEHITNLLLNL